MGQYAGRQSHEQQVHYLRKTVNYNDAGIAAGVAHNAALPPGAQIIGIFTNVTVAFNAGTTNSLVVGKTQGGNEIATAADTVCGTAGFKSTTTGCAIDPTTLTADTPVYFAYTQTGAAATQGRAVITIAYTPPNDQ